MIRRIITIGLLFMAISCVTEKGRIERSYVSVSILPQKYFLERLAGDLVTVNVMVPEGASPAAYEPTVSQLNNLDRTSIYFRMGYLGFETTWFDKLIASNPGMKVVDLSRGIETIQEDAESTEHDHDHGGVDPHIWMSVNNVRVIAGHIHRELLLQFPEERERLDLRFEQWMEELDSLDQSIRNSLDTVEKRNFMVYHPALAYFARDYDLQQFPLELDGKTPSPAHMKQMVDLGHEKGISILFIQKQFDQNNAKVLAKEIGATIVQIDPLDPDWTGQMIHITDCLISMPK